MTPDDGDGDGGFLGRWARRKQEAQRAKPAELPGPANAQSPAADAPHTLVEAPAADLPLPSLDSIVPGTDVAAFFQSHVPEALRTAALRKLWTTDPEISSFIEMADYQWDFNNPDTIPGWSSTLPKTDVKRLAKQLLGGWEDDKRPAEQPLAVAEATETPQQIPGDASPPYVRAAEEPEPEEPGVSVDDAAVVATQKIPEETVIYAPLRKRHGGALPT